MSLSLWLSRNRASGTRTATASFMAADKAKEKRKFTLRGTLNECNVFMLH